MLFALAARLDRFGPAEGAPEWLISGVWLCTHEEQYLATASAEVLGNGYVGRPLNIHRPRELVRAVQAELPDVSARLIGRKGDLGLEFGEESPRPPPSLEPWPAGGYSTQVLIRLSRRHARLNKVACALLMESEAASLLVGTDPSTLAMVMSQDPAVIGRYRNDCEALTADQYLKRCRS